MNSKNTFLEKCGNSYKKLLLLVLVSFCGLGAFAQIPANDDPCAAVTLTPATTCTYQTFTTVNATISTGFPAPVCGAVGPNTVNGDVWFQVTVPAGGALNIDTQTGTITDGVMAIYSGDCNTMVFIECDDDDSPNGNMSMINVTGLTPGSTLWIRIWQYGTNSPTGGTFGICVTIPPPPPANDNCTGAISVPVNPNFACAQTVNGSTVSATQTTGVPAPSCGATGVNDDVWFSFVATGPTHNVVLSNVSGGADMAMSVYSGASCAALTHLQCSDPNEMTVTGLTAGQTYYVRVWTWTATAGSTASFIICVGTPPPPPANDNCANAVSLTVNPDLNCGVVTAGTTVSALPSTGVPAPSCGATGVNDDVWYSFVATTTQHVISLLNVTGNSTDMAMSVYSGASCAALTHMQCSDPNTMAVGGLTVGQRYYVRVWTWSTTVGSSASFNICVGTPPPPPANDDPCNAITLPVNENGTCNFQQFTNASATGTSGVPAPGCASYSGGDVWFKVIVPCTGKLDLDANTGVILDGGMAIYSGTTCSNLTLIECDDDDSQNGAMPKINRSGLTPGSTIWIRFWEYGNDNNGTFRICVSSPVPPVTLPGLPPSPTCALAQPLCTSTTPYTIPNISGQTPTNAPGGGIYGCLTFIPNPTYYVLNIQTPGSIELTISQVSTTGGTVDVDFVIWGPFANASAACTGLSASNIVDCSYLPDPVEQINIPNALAGQVYILLVTNFGNQAGMITYQQTAGTGSSSCCPISATNSGPYFCQGGGSFVNLTSTTVPNASYIWTGPNCWTSTQQNPANAPVPSVPGQYIYTVTAYTPTGQVCADTTIITVLPKPSIGVDTTYKICAGTTTNLTTLYNTTGLTGTWTLGGAPVANPAAVNVTGIYRLIAANPTGCSDTAFVNLTVDTVRSEVSVAQIICTRTATITVSNISGISPYQYSISTNPGVFQPSNQFIAPEGTHTIITRDSLGCTTTNQATVTIIPEITVNAGPDLTTVTGETVQLLATVSAQPTSILWTPPAALSATNILNPSANPTATTTYTISVTNSQGCVDDDDITITVIPYCIKVNNAFTPNGDGINDLWQVYDSYDCLRNVSVHVFNRYGNKVYENKDYRRFWDGRYDNKPVPDGTYYAVVDFTLITGKKITIKTDLTILR